MLPPLPLLLIFQCFFTQIFSTFHYHVSHALTCPSMKKWRGRLRYGWGHPYYDTTGNFPRLSQNQQLFCSAFVHDRVVFFATGSSFEFVSNFALITERLFHFFLFDLVRPSIFVDLFPGNKQIRLPQRESPKNNTPIQRK